MDQNVFKIEITGGNLDRLVPGNGWSEYANIYRKIDHLKHLGEMVARTMYVKRVVYNPGVSPEFAEVTAQGFADACQPPLGDNERTEFLSSVGEALNDFFPAKQSRDYYELDWARAVEGKG